ncbi:MULTISPECIES: tetratricopeptide repeat protein [unclassified Streptomyces]|uniref:tetratricopeptide repeat protein n=1 Tax=unclassified Streptomyces TaxID=2593676 RepID=UPI003369C9DD
MTDDDATNALLIKASSLLRDCGERLMDDAETDAVPRLLEEASRCYDAVARKLSPDDVETAVTAATVAVGRSTVAALALTRCVLDELDCDWSWEEESDGPYLGHMRELDEDGISEPLVARAIEAAREALDADPGDPLVPLQLAHALCWSGDRDGAVAAYAEVLRRDPEDRVARDRLDELGEEVPEDDDFDGTGSPDRYAFALVRAEAGNASWGWSSTATASGSVAAARSDADAVLGSLADADLTWEELSEMLRLTLEIHRPGQPVTRFDLIGHVPAEPRSGSFLIDWPGIPEGEPLDPPLPPGRPVRIGGQTCFYGVSDAPRG